MSSKARRITFILIIVISLFGLTSIVYYDTNCIEVCHYEIQNSSLGDILGGLKVVHLSDLHSRNIGAREKKILEILREEKPDLIFVTGDFINFGGSYQPAAAFFKQMDAPLGVYAILGNTEYSNENGSCILCHEENSKGLKKQKGPIFLRNSSVSVNVHDRTLQIIGIDDWVSKKNGSTAGPKGTFQDGPAILLAHSPEIIEEASHRGVDLVLSGHTHGGQIFLTRYLTAVFPLIDPAFQFLGGFFQKGNTLMYVNRGVGTSFLPFRLGVKAEVAFFTFSGLPGRPKGSFDISNSRSKTFLAEIGLENLIYDFEFPDMFSGILPRRADNVNVLFDFESDAELKKLNWECHKWFELSNENTTSGSYSLRILLPPGQYPGIRFRDVPRDWSQGKAFKMDIFNPAGEEVVFHVRIDDQKSGWEYADRFDLDVSLKPGMNNISIPTNSMKTNIRPRQLALKHIERLMVFIPNNLERREIYLDNMRLE